GVLDVDFDLALRIAAACVHHVVAVGHENGTFRERGIHLISRNVGHGRRGVGDCETRDERGGNDCENRQNGAHGYFTVPAATFASSSSCCAVAAPLTPTAPTT